jgi:hypothetical protein
MSEQEKTEFEKAADGEEGGGLARDLLGFLKESKKWWLIPLALVLLTLALLIFLSSTGAAPFIYTLF